MSYRNGRGRGGGGRGRGRDVNLPAWMTEDGAKRAAPEHRAAASPAKRTKPPQGEAKWMYIDKHGQPQGPFSTAEMAGWAKCGFFEATMQVQRVFAGGLPPESFRALSDCDELSVAAPPGTDAAAAPGGGSGGGGGSSRSNTSGGGSSGAGWGSGAPLPDQGSVFATGMVKNVQAGQSASTPEVQALFLTQRARQFAQELEAGQASSTGEPATTGPKPPKPKKKGGGGFMAAFKSQAKRTEQKKAEHSMANIAGDMTEKQGENQGIFTYLQPPMGH